jgi:hypothetical protein
MNPAFRCPASGDDLMVSPFVGASAELMTPGLSHVPGRPRLFLHGDVLPHFASSRDVAKEGAPGELALPDAPAGQPDPTVTDIGILGQGSKTSVDLKPLVIAAGAGIAFTVDAWGRRLRIKPSAEYLREDLEVSGVVKRAINLPPDGGNELEDFLLIELRGSQQKTYHGIGPGLELEMDAARAGPFMLSLFLSGRAYRMLGDLGVTLTDSTEISDPDPPPPGPRIKTQTVSADWTFEKAAWSYQGGVGLRFRWLPE